MFIEILFKILLFKGGVLIYAEHCILAFVPLFLIVQAALSSLHNLITAIMIGFPLLQRSVHL